MHPETARVAIIHDWLVVYGGAERVLAELIHLFPQADIYSTVCFLPEEQGAFLQGRKPRTTFIQRLPRAAKHYRAYLPLMPIAVEQLDLSAYDLVISSSYCAAKGVITGPNQTHVSYTHSSARYAWDLQGTYLREAKLERGLRSALARFILHYFRMWDVRTAHGVDKFVANSRFVAARIRKTYGRDATVVYPPVDIEAFRPGPAKEDFYLTASRMVPYKKIPMIVEAFSLMPDKRLIVIGDGPEMPFVKKQAKENVTILGYQPQSVLLDHMQRAKAFVFAAEEDFGIVPLEAQACGTPVIAYGRGGALETIIGTGAEATGVFFGEQTPQALAAAITAFERIPGGISPELCRRNAMRFSPERFRGALMKEIRAAIDEARVPTGSEPEGDIG